MKYDINNYLIKITETVYIMDNIKDINSILNHIQDECVLLHGNIRNHIFSDIDYNSIVQFVPMWIRDAGNSAECGLSKELFEKLIAANNNVLTNKFLYVYDCDLIVASLQDRFCMLGALIDKFYKRIGAESAYKMEDFDSATMTMSQMDADVFAYLNSIFIFIGSSFDILTKICSEFKNIDLTDYSSYPKLKSKNVQFGDFKLIHEDLRDNTIFNRSAIIKKIESIRNRIVHDGSFDFRQIIYIGYVEKDDCLESHIMFPDFEDNQFVSFKNRRNFYSKSDRINLMLPDILKEILEIILNTIKKTNLLYHKEMYINKNDFIAYKEDIYNWSKSALAVFQEE